MLSKSICILTFIFCSLFMCLGVCNFDVTEIEEVKVAHHDEEDEDDGVIQTYDGVVYLSFTKNR